MLRKSPDCVKLLNTEGRISFMSENGMCAMEIDDLIRSLAKHGGNFGLRMRVTDCAPALNRPATVKTPHSAGAVPLPKGRCATGMSRLHLWSQPTVKSRQSLLYPGM